MTRPQLTESPGWQGDRTRGAALGRTDKPGQYPNIPRKFYLTRIRINSGGYDAFGAYWGIGQPLYWANWQGDGADSEIEFFFRARNRDAAKAEVRSRHPAAIFYR